MEIPSCGAAGSFIGRMSFTAIIFDLDGTLLDTLEDIADAANAVLLEHGFPTHDPDEYRHFIGDGVTMLMSRALPPERREDDLILACVKEYGRNYGCNWDAKTRPYDGIPALLNQLTARQLKTAILSNKPDNFTRRCAQKFFGQHRFEMVLGQREGFPAKPDPTGALSIAAYLALPPSRFLYVGDSGVDMETAVRAGMFPVAALWGFRSREELQAYGAKALIEQPLALFGLLDDVLNRGADDRPF